MRILIVEDESIILRNLIDSVHDWGYECVGVIQNELAFQEIEKDDIDVILYAWSDPKHNVDFIRAIREINTRKYLYIIVLISSGRIKCADDALDAGADDCIYKPFDTMELHARLRKSERMLGYANMQQMEKQNNAIEFYSCFISYSSQDQGFVEQLYRDLVRNNIKTWYAPEDLTIGAEIRNSIDQNIIIYDKLLLVLSKNSVYSQWVEFEVELALEKERKYEQLSLFPIRLDDHIFSIKKGWGKYIKNTRNIGDFSGWHTPNKYENSFQQILRDLRS